MSKELDDHNEGQKDGANARTFLDSMAAEWNPFVSAAYRRGFRHGLQHQRHLNAAVPEEKKPNKPPKEDPKPLPEDSDEVETPWIITLLIAFYAIIFGALFFLLRWIIQRPWRLAIALIVAGGIAWAVSRGENLQRASERAVNPPRVSQTGALVPPSPPPPRTGGGSPTTLPPTNVEDPHGENSVREPYSQGALNPQQIIQGSVGPVRIGMTVAQVRQALPELQLGRTEDGDGLALIEVKNKETLEMTLYAGETKANGPIDEQARVQLISVFGETYKTPEGVHVGMPLSEAEKRYGKITGIDMSEMESREYAHFSNPPARLSFRVGLPEIGIAGIYPKGKRETKDYAPSAIVNIIGIGKLAPQRLWNVAGSLPGNWFCGGLSRLRRAGWRWFRRGLG